MKDEGGVAQQDRAFFNNLLAFSNYLGLPIEGFEEEILTFMEKIRKRK